MEIACACEQVIEWHKQKPNLKEVYKVQILMIILAVYSIVIVGGGIIGSIISIGEPIEAFTAVEALLAILILIPILILCVLVIRGTGEKKKIE